jgi:hypothetical protein
MISPSAQAAVKKVITFRRDKLLIINLDKIEFEAIQGRTRYPARLDTGSAKTFRQTAKKETSEEDLRQNDLRKLRTKSTWITS